MTTLLRFALDPESGLPRLEDPAGTLERWDRERLERGLAQNFPSLVSTEGEQTFVLADPDGDSPPRRFQVTVEDRDRRCPTLVLEPLAPEPPEPEPEAREEPDPAPESRAARWQAEFLAEAADFLSAAGDKQGEADLAFVLNDLRTLVRKDPQRLAPLLLAGYLHVGDALALRQGDVENRYARAAEALARLENGALPAGTLAPLLPSEAPPARAGWLARLFS